MCLSVSVSVFFVFWKCFFFVFKRITHTIKTHAIVDRPETKWKRTEKSSPQTSRENNNRELKETRSVWNACWVFKIILTWHNEIRNVFRRCVGLCVRAFVYFRCCCCFVLFLFCFFFCIIFVFNYSIMLKYEYVSCCTVIANRFHELRMLKLYGDGMNSLCMSLSVWSESNKKQDLHMNKWSRVQFQFQFPAELTVGCINFWFIIISMWWEPNMWK